jgi:hypothetical protein
VEFEEPVTQDANLIAHSIDGFGQAFHILMSTAAEAGTLDMGVAHLHADKNCAGEPDKDEQRREKV